MAKSSTVYMCESCGASFPKWQGQCDQCQEWNTLVEQIQEKKPTGFASKPSPQQMRQKIVTLPEVEALNYGKNRISTGILELDRVLGGYVEGKKAGSIEESGGMVPGAVMLIGGEPGIGKSTILTQMVVGLMMRYGNGSTAPTAAADKKKSSSKSTKKTKPEAEQKPFSILYVSGEESPNQIKLRINRILENEYKNNKEEFGSTTGEVIGEHFLFCTSTDTDEVAEIIRTEQPSLVIVDSIQTLTTSELSGAAGSAGQIRESADRLTTVAKQLHIPMFLVGHVTKEGVIAGPKVLEHIVDAVLELSGERTGDLRVLRAVKNRFGATDEVGVFKMNEWGLEEVSNPSQIFLEHAEANVPGSATVCVMEGTRPLMVEVQALVVSSQLAMPRRVGRGIELPRIQVLAAILQKHCRIPIGSADVFLSAVGGLRIKEPAADLGLAVALASSHKNQPLPGKIAWIGEIGLLGEIRSVSHLDKRIKEAKRLGFETVVSRKTHKKVLDVLKEYQLV